MQHARFEGAPARTVAELLPAPLCGDPPIVVAAITPDQSCIRRAHALSKGDREWHVSCCHAAFNVHGACGGPTTSDDATPRRKRHRTRTLTPSRRLDANRSESITCHVTSRGSVSSALKPSDRARWGERRARMRFRLSTERPRSAERLASQADGCRDHQRGRR